MIAGVAGGAAAMDAKEFHERVDAITFLIGRRTQKPQPISLSREENDREDASQSALVALSVIAGVAGGDASRWMPRRSTSGLTAITTNALIRCSEARETACGPSLFVRLDIAGPVPMPLHRSGERDGLSRSERLRRERR